MTARTLIALTASASLALSGCATLSVPLHQPSELDRVATSCGLAPGELIQDQDLDGRGLLLLVRRNATEQQQSCARQWAARNHLRAISVNKDRSSVNLNEGCEMFALLAATGSIMLVRVTPDYLPAINMNGSVQRVVGMTIKGPPETIPATQQRIQAEGWATRLADERCVEVNPAGHSLDEVTALSFRVNNGEFGDMKLNFILRPNAKLRD